MEKKKILFPVIAILLVAVSIVGGMYAYLVNTDKAENTFVIGGVNTEIVENFEPPAKLEPGVEFTKDVKVKNLGPSDCYIRIKAVFTDSDMGDYCTLLNLDETNFYYNEEDGYYYYTRALGVGDYTTSLFTGVKLSDEIDEAEIKDFDILIYSEAYQSSGFDNYSEAWEYYKRNKPSNTSGSEG